MEFTDTYRNKTVLVTGHTGFKGSWLSEWLCMLGANVIGVSLPPDHENDPSYTSPSHFHETGLGNRIGRHLEVDVRDRSRLGQVIHEHEPDFVFHLAAQSLVLGAYEEPHWTFETNILGVLNVLEGVRSMQKPCIVIVITTDKVYENVGWLHSYREPDPLGGTDPYSASKACAEHVVEAYWKSFFEPQGGGSGLSVPRVLLAPVRAGNVIGGGDWAGNRIVPDTMKALAAGKTLRIRNRHATRPWQHVLEPLNGYLHLASLLHRRRAALEVSGSPLREADLQGLIELCTPFNFGPALTSNRTVGALVDEIFRHWRGSSVDWSDADAPPEAAKLNLTIDKAFHILGWQPRWDFEETVRQTVDWYRRFHEGAAGDPEAVASLTRKQILEYSQGPTCAGKTGHAAVNLPAEDETVSTGPELQKKPVRRALSS